MNTRFARIGLATVLVASLIAGVVVARSVTGANRTTVVAYFANSNGVFVGDEVRILGVAVGTITKIEPQPESAKITFSYDDEYKVPASANAVILSPSLVTARAIQLTPAYTTGAVLQPNSVIPIERTAVPVEYDEFRKQLQKLSESLQPTEPGGVSTLGAFVDTAADNLRGQGVNVRDTIVKLSAAFSALGDHSNDLFSTLKNLSILVSALQDSTDLMRQLNGNLAAVTGLLSNGSDEVGQAVKDINDVVGDVRSFVADNRESIGTTSDRLASVTKALVDSEDDLKQTLHITPGAFQNFLNIYQPAQGTFTGAIALNNFADPISFLCGAIQAASRLNAEQSAKLCVQYLAPIIKNRQVNFLPIGENLFVGPQARPNEITYSEEWMRPDYVPPPGPGAAPAPLAAEAPTPPAPSPLPGPDAAPLAAEAPTASSAGSPPQAATSPIASQPTNPADGLPGLMVPPGAGS